MMAVDSEDHIIQMGARWLQRAYDNNFSQSHEIHAESARLGREQYYIDSFFLKLKRLPLVSLEHIFISSLPLKFYVLDCIVKTNVCCSFSSFGLY
jgi:hypothetical protein